MQDIADRVHVSRSTVSLVLSGKAGSRVSEEVKKKVRQAAKDLNYHINDVARSLRTGASKLIAVIITDISNEFFGRLTHRIQEAAQKEGYLVLMINTNEDPVQFENMVRVLIGRKVDGIIAVPPPGGEETVRYVQEMGVPIVTVDRTCEGLDVGFVGIDNYAAARSAMNELLYDGFRKISMVGLDLDIAPLNQRRDAYLDAMKEQGLEENIDLRLIPYGVEEEPELAKVFRGLADAEAVFFTSRRAFTQAMAQRAWLGQKLPDQQCLLCFDDIQAYLMLHSDIRYVEQPVDEMAHKAFEILMGQIHGIPSGGPRIFSTRCISNRKLNL